MSKAIKFNPEEFYARVWFENPDVAGGFDHWGFRVDYGVEEFRRQMDEWRKQDPGGRVKRLLVDDQEVKLVDGLWVD